MRARHLIIIAADRVALRDLVEHLPEPTDRYEVHVDRRWTERRRAVRATSDDRRREQRRRRDISAELRREGWALIPAEERGW